jgi:hypothetical protein
VVKALCYKPEGSGFETRWVNELFSIYPILPAALGPGFIQSLTEISTRNIHIMFLGSKARPVSRAHTFAANCEPTV